MKRWHPDWIDMSGMTTSEVAKFFDVFQSQIRVWRDMGLLSPASSQGRALYPVEAVQSLLPTRLQGKNVRLLSGANIVREGEVWTTQDDLNNWRRAGVLTAFSLPGMSLRYVLQEVVQGCRVPRGLRNYSVDELADILGIHPDILGLAIQEQRLVPARRSVSEPLFAPSAVRIYLINQLYAK
jgi:hypothetical protein